MSQVHWIKAGGVEVDHEYGLTKDELDCLKHLGKCHEAFLKLPREHPDELRELTGAIHVVQELLALRIVRRHYPLGWPVKKSDN